MALPADFRPLRVLVAEDNPVNQRLVTFVLEALGRAGDLADPADRLSRELAEEIARLDQELPRDAE
jgi:CheY-like chemotaxis protein